MNKLFQQRCGSSHDFDPSILHLSFPCIPCSTKASTANRHMLSYRKSSTVNHKDCCIILPNCLRVAVGACCMTCRCKQVGQQQQYVAYEGWRIITHYLMPLYPSTLMQNPAYDRGEITHVASILYVAVDVPNATCVMEAANQPTTLILVWAFTEFVEHAE